MSGLKRQADVPRAAIDFAYKVSKADLLELAWDYAALSNPDGADDEGATLAKLKEMVNERKAIRARGTT